MILAIINGCGGIKPQVPAHAVAKKQKTGTSVKVDDNLSKKPEYVLTVKAPVNMGNNKQAQMTVKAPVIAFNGNKRYQCSNYNI